eukprot:gnl/MRDRNA2_/MRDRNA2_85479_c1_seq1.p1 gnl/MRDRNA2_/MRDRNA2_85479_c1~~gnl/MRDRNA2_/MRDRNA2_85479_c1_seq1.p1  ORF type:complete len:288 (+),score=65.04 gnl/MRDRNA2_/MRDRNA2_85479_c1_seq1:106-969(+)
MLVPIRTPRNKFRSGGDSRVLPSEQVSITPSHSSQEPPWLSAELDVAGAKSDTPRFAWWRGLMAFPGSKTQVKRLEDKRYRSKHTAWAKLVCPVKASERKSTASQRAAAFSSLKISRGTAGLSRGSQGKSEPEQAQLPDSDIRLFDGHRVILRGNDLEKEEQRKLQVQQQRRQCAEKVCEMQAIQIALRQKHNARFQSKCLQNKTRVSEKDSMNHSAGHFYSLKGQRIEEEEVADSQAKDASKDGRATSMSHGSGDTEAPTIGETLQDTDDESEYGASLDLQEENSG